MKKGIEFFKEKGIIKDSVKEMVKFLKQTPNLSKKMIGEYLAKPTNGECLEEYLNDFNFRNKRLDEALRLLLESFRLPGESQQIERIVETFSKIYFNESNPSKKKNFLL
ncbi:SEC7-like protein [Rozella allomycis CSF55]|uniref:SEC7-like protein n=1 Tax=Rozella allomycis (strain CSF55) TaxID=988480 RepID=A0A4V1IZ52_ROZAC|nr:SEC7-like protein [Rozella allomycis CSF55]